VFDKTGLPIGCLGGQSAMVYYNDKDTSGLLPIVVILTIVTSIAIGVAYFTYANMQRTEVNQPAIPQPVQTDTHSHV
jgi:hypothetical protein